MACENNFKTENCLVGADFKELSNDSLRVEALINLLPNVQV